MKLSYPKRTCKECDQVKSLEDFGKYNKSSKDKRYWVCKPCILQNRKNGIKFPTDYLLIKKYNK